MNISEHLSAAEYEQLNDEWRGLFGDEQIDAWEKRAATERRRTYRRKAWIRIACALAAFWIVIGAVVWMVWL